jgi:hypothetical protein
MTIGTTGGRTLAVRGVDEIDVAALAEASEAVLPGLWD